MDMLFADAERSREIARDRASAMFAAGLAGYALGVPTDAVLSRARGSSSAAFARQIAMYLCHVAFEFSLGRVALAFGRDRSTAAHACHVIEDRREDGGFDAWIDALEDALRTAPAPGGSYSAIEAHP